MASHARCASIFVELAELFDGGSDGDGAAGRAAPNWFVLADDDTVLSLDNLQSVLERLDPAEPMLIGGQSEALSQMREFGPMAFGGGGLALSAGLVRRMAPTFESCARSLAAAFGMDYRLRLCALALGIDVTVHPGFHQLDVRGQIGGLLEAHPLTPLVSLHHFESIELPYELQWRNVFRAMRANQPGFMQQTACRLKGAGLASIAQGLSVRLWPPHEADEIALHELLTPRASFKPWGYLRIKPAAKRRSRKALWTYGQPALWFNGHYAFDPLPNATTFALDWVRQYAHPQSSAGGGAGGRSAQRGRSAAGAEEEEMGTMVEYAYTRIDTQPPERKGADSFAQVVLVLVRERLQHDRWSRAPTRQRCAASELQPHEGGGQKLVIQLGGQPRPRGVMRIDADAALAELPALADTTSLQYVTPRRLPGSGGWSERKAGSRHFTASPTD
jgi:hypothetical protein